MNGMETQLFFLQLRTALKAKGIITGQEYLSSIELGTEVEAGAGLQRASAEALIQERGAIASSSISLSKCFHMHKIDCETINC